MDFHVLLDAPTDAVAELQIAKLGDFDSAKYGPFSITRDDVENWQQNLASLPGGRALIDLDHRADRTPRSTEAAGWITGVHLEGDTPKATVEWTPVGKSAIAEKRYMFFSPTYGTAKDEQGNAIENALIGGALTNRPFLNMPAVTLASEERVSEAVSDERTRLMQLAADGHLGDELRDFAVRELAPPPTADSRRSMQPELLTLLGLDETADETKILEAVTELKTKAETEPVKPVVPAVKTLEEQAREQGMMILDTERVTKLVSDAQAGRQAATELHEERRDRVWTRALEQMVRVPAQEEAFRKQYELDADTTVASIEDDVKAGRKLLNATPIGENSDDATLSPADRIAKRTDELQKELSCDYNTAYLKVLDEIEEGTF